MNFIIQFYLFIIYWTIVDSYMYTVYVPLSSVQDKTKNLKRVYLIQTNKKQIQGHANQRDDMLTKTRN